MDHVNVKPGRTDQPSVPINFVPVAAGETIRLGPLTMRFMEDGSRTEYSHSVEANRLDTVECTIMPRTPGPTPHWHEMHDETFPGTQRTVRFHVPRTAQDPDAYEETRVDAKAGDYVTVPMRAPHTFSNPFDEEAKFFCTMTPTFYVNYFGF